MKKLICILCAALMICTVLCACSQSESSDQTSETASAESEENSTMINSYDSDFLNWKIGNWVQASDEQKTECAKAYLGYMGDLMGLKVTDTDLESLDSTVEDLDTIFNAEMDMTLKEIVLYGLSDPASDASAPETSTAE